MKIVIQIPCMNEEATIAEAVRSLPRSIPGIDLTDVIVIDDGSTDRSASLAREAGADAVISLPRHMGLATVFAAGVAEARARGADVLVNFDADLQYRPGDIGELIRPILENRAEIVMGDRLSQKPPPFGPFKMFLERLGTAFVSTFAGVDIRDAATGFRALNREAMEFIFLHGSFSYTLEMLVMAGMRKLRIATVPVCTNTTRRRSRLFKSVPGYISRSVSTVIRSYLMYYPLKFFATIGFLLLTAAGLLGARYLYYYLSSGGAGHIQSLILLAVLAFLGFQAIVVGLIGDVIAANRRLIEDVRKKLVNHVS